MFIQYNSLWQCLTFGLIFALTVNVSAAYARSEIIFKQVKTPTTNKGQPMEFEATVVYKKVEKGFYALEADNGQRFQPLNLPLAMRVHGTRVKVTGFIRQDIASTANYGPILDISSIVVLSKGKGHNIN